MDAIHQLYMKSRNISYKIMQFKEEEKKATGDVKNAYSTIIALQEASAEEIKAEYVSTLQGMSEK